MDTFKAIAEVLVKLGALGGILAFLYKLWRSFDDLKADKTARKDENMLVIQGLFACLDGLHQLQCNGEVTKCRQKLQEHLIKNRE